MRVAGEEAVGIYMTAYPAFIFFLSLVQLGVPIAIAKVIAELEAKAQTVKLPAVMKTATFITILPEQFSSLLRFLFVPYLSETSLATRPLPQLVCQVSQSYQLQRSADYSGVFPGYCTNRRNSMVTNHRTVFPYCTNYMVFAILFYRITIPDNAAYAMGITLLAEAVSVLYLWYQILSNIKNVGESNRESEAYPYGTTPSHSSAIFWKPNVRYIYMVLRADYLSSRFSNVGCHSCCCYIVVRNYFRRSHSVSAFPCIHSICTVSRSCACCKRCCSFR